MTAHGSERAEIRAPSPGTSGVARVAGAAAALLAGSHPHSPSDDRHIAGARVLLVDDEPAIHGFMDRLFEANGIKPLHALNGQEALELIGQQMPDMVITDVRMPVMDGWELCRRIKANPDTMLLPVLLLTSYDSLTDKVHGFNAGADEYLAKPFQTAEMVARMRGMLRFKGLRGQLENAEQVIFAFARAVEAKDAYTAGHIERVSSLAVAIGRLLGLDDATCGQLQRGGVLHDIGKIGVPDAILNKCGKLTPEEFDQIKKHPAVGEQICRSMRTLQPVLDLIRHHHERLDGSGYPDGLAGDEITVPARIMAICDVYDALTTTRSYRRAMDDDRALAIIDEGVRAGHWDGNVVRCLKTVLRQQEEATAHAG